jgi:hypothetical protein
VDGTGDGKMSLFYIFINYSDFMKNEKPRYLRGSGSQFSVNEK